MAAEEATGWAGSAALDSVGSAAGLARSTLSCTRESAYE